MLNKNQLFVAVLSEVLANRGITGEDLKNMDRENLGEIIAKKGSFDEECTPEYVINTLIGDTTIPESKELINPRLEDFMICTILDKGSDDEKQLISEYYTAKEKLDELTRTLVSLIPNYSDESKHFYENINELADYIERYKGIESEDDEPSIEDEENED